jgi:methoxymalonate biosynthesis acyl carrier protein
MEFAPKIKEFVQSHLVLNDEGRVIRDDDQIFEQGYVDSLFALQLVDFMEKEFGIQIDEKDLDLANFSSVGRMTEFLKRKKGMESD